MSCRLAQTQEDLDWAYRIRHEVFVDEQAVPEDQELDEHDPQAVHVLAFQGDQPVGTARLVRVGPLQGKVGRVAVRAAARGTGLGRQLMEHIHRTAGELGLTELALDAQVQVQDFYAALGYVAEGEAFLDCGIPHRRMRMAL